MPFELLGEIFRYLCINGPLPLRHALCISKSFNNAAVHSAYLWSTVSLDVQLFEHFRNRTCDEADAFLEQCLRRSGTTPLHLKIDFEGLSSLHPKHPTNRGIILQAQVLGIDFVVSYRLSARLMSMHSRDALLSFCVTPLN